MKKAIILFIMIILFIPLFVADARGNEVTQLQQEMTALRSQFSEMKMSYETRIAQLETKIEDLQKTYSIRAQTPQIAPPVQPQSTSLGRYFQSFNPDVSVIGDFTYHTTDKKGEDFRNQFNMRETELAFSASVDPYARGDFFFALHQEGNEWHFHLEEGYLTLLTLPIEGLQAKVGQFRSEFGKANKYHFHNLPWVDYPNIVTNYLGEEGMMQPGVSASYLIPNPWNKYIELTGQIFNNRNDESFGGSNGKDLIYLGHLKTFFDINEESTIELGSSLAAGSNTESHGKFGKDMTALEGVDLTYKWKPLKQGLYKSLTFQNELLLSQKDRPYFDDGTDIVEGKQLNSWGAYSSLSYQFAKRWTAFGRYDFSEFPDYTKNRENAYSLGLTFAQSEYCLWRLQFKRTNRNFDKDENAVWLQCDFGLGPHRKHEY